MRSTWRLRTGVTPIIPALNAGIHVLAEKPLEINTAKCKEILEAQQRSNAKLMVAYRLHFEPATLSLIEKIRFGEMGKVQPFYFRVRADG